MRGPFTHLYKPRTMQILPGHFDFAQVGRCPAGAEGPGWAEPDSLRKYTALPGPSVRLRRPPPLLSEVEVAGEELC